MGELVSGTAGTPVTPPPSEAPQTEAAHRGRQHVPHSGEVAYVLAIHGQGVGSPYEPINIYVGPPTHRIPETPQEIVRAQLLTQRIKGLMRTQHQDDVLGNELEIALMKMAGGMMENGEIFETQYLAIYDTSQRARWGDEYKPLETPPEFIQKLGSIHDRQAQQES